MGNPGTGRGERRPGMNDARATLDASISEAQFQAAVIELAQRHRWMVAHFRPARTANGWRTPVTADGAGFPDLVLAKPGRPLIIAELKRQGGYPSADQLNWLYTLAKCQGVAVWLWQPSDWPTIEALLSDDEWGNAE